ncbi:hypothetical protein [Sinobaca sp. H24]|uniref:hypothetical protein n=1 Tax=Sinobaca sp. H24 TaxID=2923376 RepID=UPI002079263C|nr:hypothetical protein [Sinobaca sp. H24]
MDNEWTWVINILKVAPPALALVISSIVAMFKAYQANRLDMILSTNYERIKNRTIIILCTAFVIMIALIMLSYQMKEINDVIMIFGLFNFIIFLTTLLTGMFLIILKWQKYISYNLVKIFVGVNYISFIFFSIVINRSLIENAEQSERILIYSTEYAFLVLAFVLYFYLSNLYHSKRYSLITYPKQEADVHLKNMEILYSYSKDIQVLNSLNDEEKINSYDLPLYLYFVQSETLQKIKEIDSLKNNFRKKFQLSYRFKKSDNFNEIIWNKRHELFFKYIKSNYYFLNCQIKLDNISVPIYLMNTSNGV